MRLDPRRSIRVASSRTRPGRAPRAELAAQRRASTGRSASPATAALGWYAADSLRHRREGAFGYEIGTELEVGSPDFLRAAEALTGAPITDGQPAPSC